MSYYSEFFFYQEKVYMYFDLCLLLHAFCMLFYFCVSNVMDYLKKHQIKCLILFL